MHRACILISVATAFAATAVPAAATTFCVKPDASCDQQHTYSTIPTALAAAANAAGPDKVQLGEATYTAPSAQGFLSNTGAAVEVAGHGAGTHLTAPAGATAVLTLNIAGSSLHDLSIDVPATMGSPVVGLVLNGGSATALQVNAPSAGADPVTGVKLLGGADVTASHVELPPTGSMTTVAVEVTAPGSVLDAVTLRGDIGVRGGGAGSELRRSLVQAFNYAVYATAPMAISDSVLRLDSDITAVGVAVADTTGVTVTDSTIAGLSPTAGASYGMVVASSSANTGATVSGTLITAVTNSFAVGNGGPGASLVISHSDYNPATSVNQNQATVSASANGFHANPGFVDATNGDYELVATSPLIDAGDPAATGTLDAGGRPRIVDGNGDGTARIDIGAFEYQRTPPQASITGPASGDPGTVLSYTAVAQDADDGESDTLAYTWRVDGAVAGDEPVLHTTFSSGGQHHVSLTVKDRGKAATTAELTVEISSPPSTGSTTPQAPGSQGPGSGTPEPGAAADKRAPHLSRLKIAGRILRVSVDEAATVTVVIQRRGRHGYTTLRSRHVAARRGRLKVPLGHLVHGRYRVRVTAVDAARNHARPLARGFQG
jgi:hypothetical protein